MKEFVKVRVDLCTGTIGDQSNLCLQHFNVERPVSMQ